MVWYRLNVLLFPSFIGDCDALSFAWWRDDGRHIDEISIWELSSWANKDVWLQLYDRGDNCWSVQGFEFLISIASAFGANGANFQALISTVLPK
jgi:hypothetical protein